MWCERFQNTLAEIVVYQTPQEEMAPPRPTRGPYHPTVWASRAPVPPIRVGRVHEKQEVFGKRLNSKATTSRGYRTNR